MAKRDMIQTAERFKELQSASKYLPCYDLSLNEVLEIVEISKHDLLKAITITFDYGFILGVRAKAKDRVPVL